MLLLRFTLTLLLTETVVRATNEIENNVEDEFGDFGNDFGGELPDIPPTTEAMKMPTWTPTTAALDVTTSSSPEAPGEIGIFDPLPYPVIDSYPRGITAREGDMVEFECKASDAADHLPNWPKHDLEIELIYEDDPKRDLKSTQHDWWEDISKSSKSRPSHPKGRIDITEVAEIYVRKEAVKKSDEGTYRCRACIYKGDPINEACDESNARFYMRVKKALGAQFDGAEASTTSTPYYEAFAEDLTFGENPRSTCQVFGDPHIISFDGMVYNLPATSCNYILSLDQSKGSFFVYGRMSPCGSLAEGVCLETVTLYAKRDAIELQRGWLVNHGGQKVETVAKSGPFTVGQFVLEFTGTTLEVRIQLTDEPNSQDWLKIFWDGFTTVTMEVPQSSRTQGLCGNNNQDPMDDFDVWGSFNDNKLRFSESMKVDRNWRCGAGQTPPTMDEIRDLCGAKKFNKAISRCNNIFSIHSFENCVHDKQPYIDACVFDQCKGMDVQSNLYEWMKIPKVDKVLPPGCNAAEAYARRCANKSWNEDGDIITEIDTSAWEDDLRHNNLCPTKAVKLENIPKLGCPQSFMY